MKNVTALIIYGKTLSPLNGINGNSDPFRWYKIGQAYGFYQFIGTKPTEQVTIAIQSVD